MSEEYPVICTLWEQLVELDRICKFEEEVLEKQMDLYASKQIDISELKAATDKRLGEISEHATMPFQLEENILKKGFRKTLGQMQCCMRYWCDIHFFMHVCGI